MEQAARILVVDDEDGIRAGCRRVLEPAGHSIEEASTLAEGLEKAAAGSFDLALLDVMMPDGSGLDLIEPLRQKDPETVIIVITGYATVELAVQALKRGAYDFISKPFEADLLLHAIDQGLERRRLSLEARRSKALEEKATRLQLEKEEMERLERFKSAFTMQVAHELRAPITAMQSFLLALRKQIVKPEQQGEILQRAIDRSQELLELVDDLLRLAEAREALEPERLQLMNLASPLEEVADLYQMQAEERGLRFEVEISARPIILARPEQMQQLWSNLISNAVKYTPQGGSVRVSLEERDGAAIGTVQDTGIGISAEHRDRIFEEFYRTPEAKAFARLGTGLGLTLVKRILDAHQGTIELDSAPGQGSRFTFRIPLAPRSNMTDAPASG